MLYNRKDMKNRIKNGTYRFYPLVKRLLTFFCVLVYAVSGAFCADFYLRSNNSWNTDGAWTDSDGNPLTGVPGEDDNVYILDGVTCTIPSSIVCSALTLNGILDFSSGTSITTKKAFTNNSSLTASDSKVLTLNVEGIQNNGTLLMEGNLSSIHVSRAIINSSDSSHAKFGNVYVDFSSNTDGVFTFMGGDGIFQSIVFENGPFSGKTFDLQSGKIQNLDLSSFNNSTVNLKGNETLIIDNFRMADAAGSTILVEGTPVVGDFYASGTDGTGNELSITGSGKIKAIKNVSGAGDYLDLTSAPEITGGYYFAMGEHVTGTVPEGWLQSSSVYTWTGADSSLVTTANNWSPAGNPGEGSIVFVPAGCSRYPVLQEDFNLGDDGIVSIESGATFNLRGCSLTAKKGIKNGGTIISQNVNKAGTIVGDFENTGNLQGNTGATSSSIKISGKADFKNTADSSVTANLEVAGNVSFSNTGTLTFKKNLTVNGTLLISSGSDINLGDSSSSEFTVLSGNIDFSEAGSVTSSGHVKAANGKIIIRNSFSLGNDTVFESPVEFKDSDITVTNASEKTLVFANELDGKGNAFTAGSDSLPVNVEFQDTVSNLSSITVNGTTTLSSCSVITSGDQSYLGNVVLWGSSSESSLRTGDGQTVTLGKAGANPKKTVTGNGNKLILNSSVNLYQYSDMDADVEISSGADVTLKTPFVTKGGLILEGNIVAGSNSITAGGNSVLTGTIGAGELYTGPVYFTNNNSSEIEVQVYSDQKLSELFVAGNVNLICKQELKNIKNLHIQDNGNTQTEDFTVGITGKSLTVQRVDVTRSSSENGKKGTLKIENDFNVAEDSEHTAGSGEFKTHSGTVVQVSYGANLTAKTYIHSAYDYLPESNVIVSGTLSADSILLVGNNNASGSKLTVNSSGKVNTKKIQVLNSYKNGSLTDAVVNNGAINVLGSEDDDGFYLFAYTGSGKLVLNGKGKLVNNGNASLTVEELEVKDVPAAVIDSKNGSFVISNLNISDTAEGTSCLTTQGTSVSNTVTLNGYSGKLLKDFTVGSGTLSLDGAVTLGLKGDFLSSSGTLVSGEGAVTSDGTFTNNGSYEANGTVTSKGNFSNTGTVSGNCALVAEADFSNSGIINGNGNITVSGILANTGTGEISGEGNLLVDGDFTNSGSYLKKGTVTSGGDFTDEGTWGADVGQIAFNGLSDQLLGFKDSTTYGSVKTNCASGSTAYLGSNLKCKSILVSTDSILKTESGAAGSEQNYNVNTTGAFTIESNGSFVSNSGNLSVGEDFTNSGSFASGSGNLGITGDFTNSGTFASTSGDFEVTGNFVNAASGSFSAGSGSFKTGGGFTNNAVSPASFAGGSGVHTVDGDFINNGTYEATTGILTVNGNLTNSGSYESTSNTLTVKGNFTNTATGSFASGNGTFYIEKNFSNTAVSPAAFSCGTGTVEFTGTGNHEVSGETVFYNLTCVEKGVSIIFESGKKQTVNGTFTVKGALDAGNPVYVTLTSSGDDKWQIDVDPANLDFEYVKVDNSESIQNIPGAIPSVRLENNNCYDCGNNIFWFAETMVFWHGGSNGSWDTIGNWKKDKEGTRDVVVVPLKNDPLLEVYIIEDTSDTGKNTLSLDEDVSVNKFEISASKNVVLGNYSVTAQTITNKGVVTISGEKEIPLVKKTGGTISHESDSQIEFKNWTSGTAVNTVSSGLGYSDGFENLKITGSGTFVFADNEGGSASSPVVVKGLFTTDAAGIKSGSTGKKNQNYKNAVSVSENVEFICDAENKIIFEETVNAEKSLKISGNVDFEKNVSAKKLEVTGTAEINASEIKTKVAGTGTQTYTGPVVLGTAVTLTAEKVVLGDAVTGSYSLNISKADAVSGNCEITAGGINIASLSVDGTISVQGSVITSGVQNYGGEVTLSGNSTFTGSYISLATTAPLNGSYDAEFKVTAAASLGSTVTINDLKITGNAEFTGALDSNALEVTGSTRINTPSMKTALAQEFTGKVTGTTAITFTASVVTFESELTSSDDLTFAANVNVLGGAVSNPGHDQVYNNAVVVNKKNAIFTGKNITFKGTLDSGTETESGTGNTLTYGVTLNGSDGEVQFQGALGTVTPLKYLTVEKSLLVKCAEIKSSGDQNFNESVTLQSNSAFTGTSVNFNDSLSGAFDAVVDGNGNFGDTVNIGDLLVTGDAVFGNDVTVKTVSVTGTSEINADSVSASGTGTGDGISMTGPVVLKKGTSLTGNNISCPGGITGAGDAVYNINFTAQTKVILGGNGINSSLGNTVITSDDAEIGGLLKTGIFNLDSNAVFSGLELNNSGLFTLYPGKTVAVKEDTVFRQTGNGKNLIKGNFSTTDVTLPALGITETVVFRTPVYIAQNTGAALSLGGGKEKIILNDNLIVCLSNASDSLSVSSPLTVKNLVLYKGTFNAASDINSTEDIVLLGGNYSTDDTEEKYTKKRRVSYNYKGFDAATPDALPDEGSTALPSLNGASLGGALNVGAGKSIIPGKNFYANGLNLHGITDADWYLDTECNTDGSRFVEAYNCDLKRSVVRYKASGSAPVENVEKACGLSQGCTFNGGTSWSESDPDNIGSNRNWDYPDFKILSVETVSDNVVKVTFSGRVRNNNNEVSSGADKVLFDNDRSFATAYGSGSFDSAEGKWKGSSLGTDELDVIYFMASDQDTWNTDATGSGSGNENSTDSRGAHKTVVPKIKFTRDVENNIVFTNRVGKILSDSGSYWNLTLDSASPVLVGLKTGQEIHTPWDSATEELSQPSYDAHNFIEFIFSEPVDIDSGSVHMPPFEADGTTKKTFENIRVVSDLGSVSESGSGLEIAGFVKIASGKLATGTEGNPDNTVHGFYRKDSMNPQEIRISVSGYTEGTVQDNNGLSYKKWIGYIDNAETPSGNVTLSSVSFINDLAVDKDGNLKANPLVSVKNGGLSVTSDGGKDYGKWDVSKPEFVFVNDQYEIIGSVVNGSAAIKRIEFHLFDNQYDDFKNTQGASWIFRRGWVKTGSDTLKVSDSYASDCFGGSRPFADAYRTSGGIRYSSVCEANLSFGYKIGNEGSYFSFADKKSYFGATSPFFVSTKGASRNPDTPDLPYFAFELPSFVQSLQTVFSLKFDKTQSYITDLAGNRLDQSMEMKSIDRTPPTFAMTVAPVGQKKLYIMFGKKIVLDGNISGREEDGTSVEKDWNRALLEAFEFGTITGSSFDASAANGLSVDLTKTAKTLYFNDDYCGIELPLTREVTYKDIESLYVRAKPEALSYLDLTGLPSDTYTFVQDSLGNFMDGYTAHILSDFAVNLVNPLYAYNELMDSDGNFLQDNLYGIDSRAVHEWDEEQGNFGTLVTDKAIHVVSEIKDEEVVSDSGNLFNIRAYFDHDPAAGTVSKEYNSAAGAKLRVWLPDISGLSIFETISKNANPVDVTSDSSYLESGDLSKGLDVEIPENSVSSLWANGSQVSFLFGIMENNGGVLENKKIDHAPVNNRDVYTVNKDSPFLALRLKNQDDILSLDMWSFRLKAQTLQRGGVSIFNNVIDVTKGEKTVIKVDNPASGRVEVMVMTLDGDVIDYLNHGNLGAGSTSFTWNGKNRAGKAVARGMYFIRVIGNGFDETRKVMVVK